MCIGSLYIHAVDCGSHICSLQLEAFGYMSEQSTICERPLCIKVVYNLRLVFKNSLQFVAAIYICVCNLHCDCMYEQILLSHLDMFSLPLITIHIICMLQLVKVFFIWVDRVHPYVVSYMSEQSTVPFVTAIRCVGSLLLATQGTVAESIEHGSRMWEIMGSNACLESNQ